MHIACVILFVYDNVVYVPSRFMSRGVPKHVVGVDKLYTADNIVVLWLLHPYRIITLGEHLALVACLDG